MKKSIFVFSILLIMLLSGCNINNSNKADEILKNRKEITTSEFDNIILESKNGINKDELYDISSVVYRDVNNVENSIGVYLQNVIFIEYTIAFNIEVVGIKGEIIQIIKYKTIYSRHNISNIEEILANNNITYTFLDPNT